MKERILIVLQDEHLLEESASLLYEHDYLVTKASNLNDMESQINAMPQDLILLESTVWIKEQPDLLTVIEKEHAETSIIHILPGEDHDALEVISKNGAGNYLFEPFASKEILLMVDQAIKYRDLMQRYQQMRNEFLEANKNLSNKTKEFQDLLAFNTNIIESINVGIITVDREYRITTWNSRMGAIAGSEGAKTVGSNLFDVLPWLGEQKLSERVKSAITQGEITELGHLKGRKQDGGEIYADYKISPIKKGDDILGAVITVDDITRKVHFRDEQDSSQRFIGNLVEHSADAIISYDLDGIVVTWNKGAEAMFGYTSQESIGRPWDFFISDSDRKKMSNMLQWVKKSRAVSNFEAQIKSKSGGIVPVSMTISIIKDKDEKVYGLSVIAKDTSQNKQLRKQLIQSQKMIGLSAMSGGIAHTISVPLTSLSSQNLFLTNRIQMNGIADFTQRLEKIEGDANRIAVLAKDLLWYLTPSDDAVERVNIHEIIDKSLFFTNFYSPLQTIQIEKQYYARHPFIAGNGKYLIQAFINLLSNAIAAMPDGGTIILQTESMSQEETGSAQAGITIKIRDTGMGIPEENLSKIFEQFFTTRPEGKGNGLGLYVVNSIIEIHKGKVEVESEINKGTCVTLWLPMTTETKIETNSRQLVEQGERKE